MAKNILCIDGEQNGLYIKVREDIEQIELPVYAKIDFKKLKGIINLPKPLRKEIYTKNLKCDSFLGRIVANKWVIKIAF